MRFTIDRFEGEYAVVELEDMRFVDVPKAILPPNAKEGDILVISFDVPASKERKEKIEGLMDKLFCD